MLTSHSDSSFCVQEVVDLFLVPGEPFALCASIRKPTLTYFWWQVDRISTDIDSDEHKSWLN
jgi:hypothetical protein